MLEIYRTLSQVAQAEFEDIISGIEFIGGTPTSPNKLRLTFPDGSFLDIWLSMEGDYSYH